MRYFSCYHSPDAVSSAVLSSLPDESVVADAEEQQPRPLAPCVACVATGVTVGVQVAERGARRLRCKAQEKRDLVLEGMLRWAVDVHFRRCSGLLQASLSRAVCDGIRQALDAAELSPGGRTPPPCFPLGCRLLLSFVGGLAGDGGAQAAGFLQERCEVELRLFLARSRRLSRTFSARGRCAAAGGIKTSARSLTKRVPELPVLDAYVGHLCLCRHLSDALAGRHLAWLARQALAVLRLLDGQDDGDAGTNTDPQQRQKGEATAVVLASLTHALTLLLTRPKRDVGSSSTIAVPENAGNVLEIVFDSDARPLSGVPIPLAEAAVGVLKAAGHLQLARPEDLLRPPPTPVGPQEGGSHRRRAPTCVGHGPPGDDDAPVVRDETCSTAPGGGAVSFADGIEFRRASVAFENSWSLAAAGLDPQLPVMMRNRKRGLEDIDGDNESGSTGSCGDSDADSDNEDPVIGNGWGRVPDEVALRVFSFMTPKRVCRLACVDRAWRELLMVSRVWRPLFEARWPVTVIDSEEDLEGVSSKLLLEGRVLQGELKHKRKRDKTGTVRWRHSEVGQVYRFGTRY